MAAAGTGRHNRLCTILVQIGTPVSKALFEKRVEELRPSDQSLSTWTAKQFLQTYKDKITTSKIGKNKKSIIYSINLKSDVTNQWDLYLITSMLIECCQLDSNIKLYISQLRKLRNKLFHMSESTLNDDKYEHYLTKLKVIFEKCLLEIQDASFTDKINEMVKTLEEVSLKQNDIDNVMDILRSMQEESNEKLSQLDHGQQLTHAKLDDVLNRLQLLTENRPALNTTPVPDSGVKIAVKNCSGEKEKEISKLLVDSFVDFIKRDPELHKEFSEISNESQQKIREAVYTAYEMFLSSGCKIVDAEEGCVRLTMQWSTLPLMIRFYQDYMTRKQAESLHPLVEALRTLDGCEDVSLAVEVDVDEFCVTADNIVTTLEEFLVNEKRVMQTSKGEANEYSNNCQGENVGGTKGATLLFRTDHSQNVETLKHLFVCGKVDTAMTNLQGVIRSAFNTPDLLVTARLIEDYSQHNYELVQSAYKHQIAEFNNDNPNTVALQEEHSEFTRKRKQDIKLGTGCGGNNWLNDEETQSTLEKPNLVIALDIGNYASGFAALTRSDFLDDPQKIICNTNWDPSGLCIYKTRTCLLLNPNKNIADFGYHAESRFNLLGLEDDDENPENWYFFKHFKNVLHQEEAVTDDTPVVGAYGKSLPAIDVFSKTIEYLKMEAVRCLQQHDVSYSSADTKWVITVSSICNEAAKLVLKHAAEKAGIPGANLSVALEPECSAIFCSQLPVHQLEIQDHTGKLKNLTAPDSIVMIIDMGGRTVNITTVQINSDSTLKQVIVNGGGPWGGMNVDEKFMTMLNEIVGHNVMETFFENFPMDEYELRTEFENRKRELKQSSDEHIFINLPRTLQDLCEKFHGKTIADILKDTGPQHSLKFVNGRLSFHPDVMRMFFHETVGNIIDYVSSVLKSPDSDSISIDSAILTGGFAESNFVVQGLREGLGVYEIPVVRPEAAELAVLNGAAIYGHNEGVMASRIMPYTYGIAMITEYDKVRHDQKETFRIGGKLCANNVFQNFVTKGQEVKHHNVVFSKQYFIADEKQTSATVLVYSSDKKNPVHVTDSGCKYIGSIEIDELASACDPEIEVEPSGGQRIIEVAMSFVGVDVKIKAISKVLGKVYQKYIKIK